MATLHLEPIELPIRREDSGTYRVGATRVSLDVVLRYMLEGQTPEQIRGNFDVLELADLYALFGYFSKRRDEAEAFVRQCDEEGDAARRKWEASHPESAKLRERLLERAKSAATQS